MLHASIGADKIPVDGVKHMPDQAFTVTHRAALLIATILSLHLVAPSFASEAVDPLFADDVLLEVTLTAPLRKMSRDKADEPDYSDGTLAYVDADGQERVLDLQVRPRGKSRRDRQVCAFPPLRLNFKKKQLEDTVFVNQNVLKLVTHCKSSPAFQRYVLKEYLAYRIFNLLSDASFKVRLLKVTYIDSERNAKPLERYGFLIEHKKRLAARLGTETADPVRIDSAELEPVQASIAELYQYLVSNTDYSFIAAPPGDTCCHNAILLKGPDGSYLPVPYDLDRTGLVDPPNALPDENLGQRSVRDRLYRGFCRDPQYLSDAIAKTLEMRPEIEALFADQPDLTPGDRKKAAKYLAAFYRTVEDPESTERRLKCRGKL
jgi:hypothetical protein